MRVNPHGPLTALSDLFSGMEKYQTSAIQQKVMIKRIVLLLFATLTLVLGSVGCRTAHGAGEDIEHAGQSIQEHTPP